MLTQNHDSSTVAAKPAEAPKLAQSLGLFSSTAIVIGSTAGFSIYIVDADITRGISSSALYIVMAAWICIVLLRYKPQYTWPGLAQVLFGMPVYLFWSRCSRMRAQEVES